VLVTLLYHHVDRRLRTDIAVSEEAFGAQLAHLRCEGYPVLTLAEVLRIASGETRSPERAVFVTFDDGYADNLHKALPLLQEHGVEATMFVPTAPVGCSNAWNTRASYEARHLDWRELEQWLEGGGMIGGHTHSHESALEIASDQFSASIQLNRRLLEQRLGIEVVVFAYPYGDVTPEARAAVSRQFDVAWTVHGGTWDPGRDRFLLNRFFVGPRFGVKDFAYGLEAQFDRIATGRMRLPGVRKPAPDPRKPAASVRVTPGAPRIVLVAGEYEDAFPPTAGTRFADLLRWGWDVHLLHRGDMTAEPEIDDLPNAVLRERVHPPPRALRRRRPRPELMIGVLGSALRRPRRIYTELARPADPDVRYLRAVLLALRPDLVCLLSDGDEAGWLAVTEAAGSRAITAEEVGAIGPVLDRTLLAWEPPSREHTPLHVLAMGPVEWQLGLEHLLVAMRLLGEEGVPCECRIVGNGNHEGAVTFARRQLELGDSVELYARCGRAAFLEHLRWADVVVNASVVPTLPSWLVDAHAAGRPVVTTELPAGLEVPALVVPRRNPEALAEALADLERDDALRGGLVVRGRQHVSQLGDVDSHLASFLEHCRRALGA
jgi:peptidoglycan/xylan/chitin deacetylase (PgdA/CDA1 family)